MSLAGRGRLVISTGTNRQPGPAAAGPVWPGPVWPAPGCWPSAAGPYTVTSAPRAAQPLASISTCRPVPPVVLAAR